MKLHCSAVVNCELGLYFSRPSPADLMYSYECKVFFFVLDKCDKREVLCNFMSIGCILSLFFLRKYKYTLDLTFIPSAHIMLSHRVCYLVKFRDVTLHTAATQSRDTLL